MNTPETLYYTRTHEWAAADGDLVTVGITDYAQDQLGDVVFIELPEVGRTVAPGEAVAVVESVKTASDIYAPVAGEVVEVNPTLLDAPEQVNEAPYERGWILRLRASDPGQLETLLSAEGYRQTVAAEGS